MFLKSFKKDLVDILTYFTGDFFLKKKERKKISSGMKAHYLWFYMLTNHNAGRLQPSLSTKLDRFMAQIYTIQLTAGKKEACRLFYQIASPWSRTGHSWARHSNSNNKPMSAVLSGLDILLTKGIYRLNHGEPSNH